LQDPTSKKITDFFSFYSLPSTVIGHDKHKVVNAAYLFYYATEAAFPGYNDPSAPSAVSVPKSTATSDLTVRTALKTRLNALINDALIEARNAKFDVFNAVTLMDNGLFLEQQKFGKGDGQLHYYLYNYNANHIAGGVDRNNEIDEKGLSGIGVVML
jgi:glycylpeptide N-tetradecanoyltransferase